MEIEDLEVLTTDKFASLRSAQLAALTTTTQLEALGTRRPVCLVQQPDPQA